MRRASPTAPLNEPTLKAHQRTVGKNDEWLTPPEILKPLGRFALDPAAPVTRPWRTAIDYFTILDGGLDREWWGRVWLNPPFNRYERPRWMEKMADHGNGIMLVPAATETDAFDRYVWQKAQAVCFIKGRPHFHYADGKRAKANCGCSIALVAYGEANASILEASGLGVTLILNPTDDGCTDVVDPAGGIQGVGPAHWKS